MTNEAKLVELRRAPRVYSRDEHAISRKFIAPNALKVLYRLNGAGYRACLVGGSVRDLLLGREPKDFDVATDARPEQVRELFRNCRLIGRRFRLAHVRFGQEIIEVATFRAAHNDDGNAAAETTDDGRILRDNVYGGIDDDVWRRDFTVNALYYDIADFSVIDYVGGVADLKQGVLRLLGDPRTRYREDPVRMLRAIRFAVKLGFRLDDASSRLLPEMAALLDDISPARLFEEVLKLFHGGCALLTCEALRQHRLFAHLFPLTEAVLAHRHGTFDDSLLGRALANTDARINEGKSVTPAFLLAAMLWDAYEQERQDLEAKNLPPQDAGQLAADRVISRQVARLAFPRRLTQVTREVWALQPRFAQRTPKRVQKLIEHPRFRAAYDFLLLRADAGDGPRGDADWWTTYQAGAVNERNGMLEALEPPPARPRRRRRRRRRA
jgi:poly(A) polymerase